MPRLSAAADVGTPEPGIGGVVTMSAGGDYLPTVYMRASGLKLPPGIPVRVVVGGQVTRVKTPELGTYCGYFPDTCAALAFFLGDDPVPPSGVPIVDAAVAYTSWDGGSPIRTPVGASTVYTGLSGSELWVGRTQFSCSFFVQVDWVTVLQGNCFHFGGGYSWAVHADDGGNGDPAAALLRMDLLSQSGPNVRLGLTTSDGSPAEDAHWYFVPDGGGTIDGSGPPVIAATLPGVAALRPARPLAAAAADSVATLSLEGAVRMNADGHGDTTLVGAAAPPAGLSSSSARAGRALRLAAAQGEVSTCDGQTTCATSMPAPAGTYVATALVHGVLRAAEKRVSYSGGGGGGPYVKVDGIPERIAPRGLGDDVAALKVSVVDPATDKPIPNSDVTLSLAAVEGTAGHAHTGDKPTGRLAVRTFNTGATGIFTVKYTAPLPAGPVVLTGTSPGATPSLDSLQVGLTGLQELGAGTDYNLIGARDRHPVNHFGTAGMIQSLQDLATKFYAKYNSKLEYNDMSLVNGGVFDLNGDWVGPHAEHRMGTNCDMRTAGRTTAQLKFVTTIWEDSLAGSVHDETGTSQPHYHLRH